MLRTIEWRDDGLSLTRLTAEIERHLRTIEPEAEMILVGGCKCRRGATRRDRERFDIEDTTHRRATCARTIRFEIALIPGNTKGLVRDFNHEEVIASTMGKAFYTHLHGIVQRTSGDRDGATGMRQAC